MPIGKQLRRDGQYCANKTIKRQIKYIKFIRLFCKMVTGFQFSVTTPYFHTDQYVQQAHNTCKSKYAIL